MKILFNLAFIIFGIFYIPYLVLTKRYRYGLKERMGFLPKALRELASRKKIIWIHAVSVGEMKTAGIIAPLLRKSFPSHTLVFSSVTNTGNKVARTVATPKEGVFYLPFDISFVVNKVVKTLRPEIFICMETELWPNLISGLKRANTKIVLVNGRISERSYVGYRKIKFVTSVILKKFSLILMQSEKDKKRILELGAPEDKVFASGNLKFDLPLIESSGRRREIRENLKINDKDVLLIAGSTHRGEEEVIIDCILRLKKDYPFLRLLIAPRHVERTGEIIDILTRYGFRAVRFSSLNSSSREQGASGIESVYILDTIGELGAVYSASDIVFIGGSLVQKGGQNPIEAASLGKPIVLGKFTFNFQDVVKSFLENKGVIQVEDKDEFFSIIKLLLDNQEKRDNLGINARATVDKNSGSSKRTIDLILLKVK